MEKVAVKKEKMDSEEVDWELVESFKRGLEDIKEGRVEEI